MRKTIAIVIVLAFIVFTQMQAIATQTKNNGTMFDDCLSGNYDACLYSGGGYYMILHPERFRHTELMQKFLKIKKKERQKIIKVLKDRIKLAFLICVKGEDYKSADISTKTADALCRMLEGYFEKDLLTEIKDINHYKDAERKKKAVKAFVTNAKYFLAYVYNIANRFHDAEVKKDLLVFCKYANIDIKEAAKIAQQYSYSNSCTQDERQVTEIVYSFYKTHRVRASCKIETINGVTTETCGSVTVKCTQEASFTNNACTIDSNYSSAVNTQVAKIMRAHGYNVSTQLNLATAFTSYIAKSFQDCYINYSLTKKKKTFLDEITLMGLILSEMINNAEVIQFQKLVDLFVKNRIFHH